MEPKIMLFDQPTRWTSRGADRVVFMDEGRIVDVGTHEYFFQIPQNERTRRFPDQVLHQLEKWRTKTGWPADLRHL